MQDAAALRVQAAVRGHLSRKATRLLAEQESKLLHASPPQVRLMQSMNAATCCKCAAQPSQYRCARASLVNRFVLQAHAQAEATAVAREQRLLAKRDQTRAAVVQDFEKETKTARRRLKELEGPRMRNQIQHKVTTEPAIVQGIASCHKCDGV